MPIGAFAEISGQQLMVRGLVGSVDGERLLQDKVQGSISDAEALGIELAEKLLSAGADEILREVYEGDGDLG